MKLNNTDYAMVGGVPLDEALDQSNKEQDTTGEEKILRIFLANPDNFRLTGDYKVLVGVVDGFPKTVQSDREQYNAYTIGYMSTIMESESNSAKKEMLTNDLYEIIGGGYNINAVYDMILSKVKAIR